MLSEVGDSPSIVSCHDVDWKLRLLKFPSSKRVQFSRNFLDFDILKKNLAKERDWIDYLFSFSIYVMAESSASGAVRRRPRKLDRNRSDQDSVRSGQKHTVLDDTEVESIYPAASEAPGPPQIQDIEEEDTAPAAAEASLQPRQRRRPRKLIRNAASGPGIRPSSAGRDESIDVRVNRLESQVHALSRRLDSTTLEIGRLQASSPRSSTFPDDITAPPQRSTIPPVQADILRNAQTATANLERVNPSFPRGASTALIPTPTADDEIEDIPRPDLPTSSTTERPLQARTVSLTGNYKIPLPSTLSTDDVRAIKDGVYAAGSIAKEITAAFRGSSSAAADTASIADGDVLAGTETPKSPGSWARLIEGASQLVQKAARAIEVDAAVEATGEYGGGVPGGGGGGREGQSGQGQAQGQTKWRRKTAARTAESGAVSPTPSSAPEASTSKGKGKRPAGPARAASGAAGSSSKAV